jgi:hypothetical protein
LSVFRETTVLRAAPFFGYGGLLKPSDCDGHLLEQVAAAEVVRFLRLSRRICFGSRGLFLNGREGYFKHRKQYSVRSERSKRAILKL